MVRTSFSMERKQKQKLDNISKITGIPCARLIRKGVKIIINQYSEQGVIFDLDKNINKVVQEHDKSLRELAGE